MVFVAAGFLLDGLAPAGDHFGDFGDFGLELVKGGDVGEFLLDEGAGMKLEDLGDSTGLDEVDGFVRFRSVFGHDEELEEF